MTTPILIVPGLDDSSPDHWQSWLQRRAPASSRVAQPDWSTPDLRRWSAVLNTTLLLHCRRQIVVAHSFGCLALAAAASNPRVAAALLVAPADPARFGIADHAVDAPLPFPSIVVASRNDPWMAFSRARALADRWGARLVDAGRAGHINVASGHGPWPKVLDLIAELGGAAARPIPRQLTPSPLENYL